MDLPVTGGFSPEELHSYPPRIMCQFFPEQGAVSTTCTLSLYGFNKPVSVDMALLTPQRTVDTHQLKVYWGQHHDVFFDTSGAARDAQNEALHSQFPIIAH